METIFELPADEQILQPALEVTAGRWAPALPWQIHITIDDRFEPHTVVRALTPEQAIALRKALGDAIDAAPA